MKPADPLDGLLPPAPPGRDLPHHDRHRGDLLAVVRSERTGERRWPVAAWLAPLGAALAVLVIVAGVFVLPGLLGGPRSGGPRSGGERTGTGPAPSGSSASGGQHGTLIRRTESSLVSSALTGLVVRGHVGTVNVTGADRSTVAITGVGAVAIRVPPGTAYKVTASTQVGSVRITVPQSADSSHVIRATTGTGTVAVTGS